MVTLLDGESGCGWTSSAAAAADASTAKAEERVPIG